MSIQNYFDQAQLALATYGNLLNGALNSAENLAELTSDRVGMSSAQASAFAAKWSVADQYTAPLTGVSATVFQAVAGGPKHLAIRGTQGPTDFLSNGLILLGFPPELTFQYPVLKAQVQTWLGNGTLTPGFSVAGHSLGGFLAAGLVADFGASVSHAYLYNTPGYNILHSLIAQALGFSNTPDASKITSIRADAGISPIAALNSDFSPPIPIHIENQFLSDVSDPPASLNHSQRVLTDSLALYATFARIDPTASVESITKIIKTASAQNGNTLETTLDALRTLFQQNYQYGQLDYDAVPTMIGDGAAARNEYYLNLQSLQTWWQASPFTALAIQPLAETSGSQIAALAMADTADGQAYRHALYKLNPFAVTGSTVLYDGINAHGQLNRYNPASGSGSLTDQYLKDRAAMLSWKMKYDVGAEDADDDLLGIFDRDNKPYSEKWDSYSISGDWDFIDLSAYINGAPLKLAIDGVDLTTMTNHQIVFGSQNADSLNGDELRDYLYGGAGADTLSSRDAWKEAA